MIYDTARNRIVLFGGMGYNSRLTNDTWEYDGTDWVQQFPNNSPSPRFVFSMVYDVALQKTILFGGGGSSNLNDTWEYDGINWAQKFPTNSPHRRYMHDMAYDSVRNKVVLFGGTWYDPSQGGFNLDDTWEYDGNNWIQKTPLNSPLARAYHSMAFDNFRGQTVLIGGAKTTFWNSTWEYDGNNWVQKTTSNSPPYRIYQNMAYSSGLKRTVLYGGDIEGGIDDTWEYDGSNWTEAHPSSFPPRRLNPHMAYDSARGCIVLFGGQIWSCTTQGCGYCTLVNDTWEYCDYITSDTTPDPFTFTDQSGVTLNTAVTSNAITVSGINTPSPISIIDGEYSINSGAFTSALGTVSNGDSVSVRQTSSSSYSTTTNATLTIGGVSGSFSVMTMAIIFTGFFSPVDNPPALNMANAGQAIPVKWRITDANGAQVSTPASFKSLTSYSVNCDSFSGDSGDVIEEYAAGSSELKYLGDGNWQFKWSTSKTYAKQCRMMVLTLGDNFK